MTNTIVSPTEHVDRLPDRLPVIGCARARVAALRSPVTVGVDIAAAQQGALIVDVTGPAYRSAMTDAAVKGAFPGSSAWSPPI